MQDLALALKSGKLAGAALDVYQNEPYQPADGEEDLRQLPNVLMTPHFKFWECKNCGLYCSLYETRPFDRRRGAR